MMNFFIIIVLCLFSLSVNSSSLPIDYFAKQSQFSSIKLFPDGTHIAPIVPKGKTSNLVVINRKSMKLILDGNGVPVIASEKDREGEKHKYFYLNKIWQEVDKKDPLNKYCLLSVNSDASKQYLKRSIKSHTEGLYEYDFINKRISLLYNHPVVDINSFIREPGTRTIVRYVLHRCIHNLIII